MNLPTAPSPEGTEPPPGPESAPSPAKPAGRWGRRIGTTGAVMAVTAALFLLVEGAASSLIVLNDIWEQYENPEVTEQRHTTHDEELGWVSIPGTEIPDLYGAGKGLVTNNRGFRNAKDTHPPQPPGKHRVICSGDSFTLGYGVSTEAAWCQQLAVLDSAIEPVNMGQGGYGIDQAYLWHQRDGADLDRTVHVFAFIGDDFLRMQNDHFFGFAKPMLRLEDNRLVVGNVPVPRRGYISRWLAQNGALFRELRSVRLLGAVVNRVTGGPTGPDNGRDDETWRVAAHLFQSLADENAARGARFVIVFLPAPWDYDTNVYDAWRERVHAFADRTGIPFVDMVEELRLLNEPDARGLFIPRGEIGAPHLNEAGNRWVARHLHEGGLLTPPSSPDTNPF